MQVRQAKGYDVALLQRQLIATINTFESRIAGPRILDVDDAIWLTCRFKSVDHLAGACEAIICGNDFLAEHFTKINHRVHVIPTAVDTNTWIPSTTDCHEKSPTIGWIGTRGNHQYLYAIERSLAEVLRESVQVRLLIVSDAAPRFTCLPPSRVVYRRWTEAEEVGDVRSMSIGIMPLADSMWARGKCGSKLLQYMACGVPAVASPVGANVQIAAHGGVLLADSAAQWTEALLHLLGDQLARTKIGANGRTAAVRHYSTDTVAANIADVICACA